MNKKKIISVIAGLIVIFGIWINDKKLIRLGESLFSENEMNIVNDNKDENSLKLIKCIDGDTAEFSEIGKTRFLLIDTPESTNKIEPYGKKASQYTCNSLRSAKHISYEYEGAKKDHYGRSLAYIFVDGELLQEKIAKEGFVKKLYKSKKQKTYKYERKIIDAIDDKYDMYEGIKWIS
ncbi:MAG: thermonuclease family protein [Erysipelotrichales bacterium]